MKAASKSHSLWGLESTLRDDAHHAADMLQVEENYKAAKKALATIAAVNCLANMQGTQKLEKRDALLRQADLMPKLLVAALEKLK